MESRQVNWRLWAGLAALAAAVLGWFAWRYGQARGFEWALFTATFRGLDPAWLGAACFIAWLTYVGRALRWRVLIRPLKSHPNLWNLFTGTAIGFTAIVLFGRPGEMVRPYVIGLKERLSFSSQVATWLVERMYDLMMALLIFGVALSQVKTTGVKVGPGLQWVLSVGGYAAPDSRIIYKMFTSLRSRLWLSYAFVITVALTIVAIVLLIFLIRNPVLTRETQQQLKTVQNMITADPEAYLSSQAALQRIAKDNKVRVLVFSSARAKLIDSNQNDPSLPSPRRNLFNRNSQTAVDGKGNVWLYTTNRLTDGRFLVVAALRPRVPFLNIFADEFLLPIVEGGVIAFLISLVLAYMLSRSVADPLQKMIVAARKYPSEDMNPIEPQGPHEVQDLARAFNSMIARVHSSQQSQRDFVANVSHELKTPLTSIQGFAQAILDDTADTPAARKQAAQIIYNESARMHRLALDLLDLARLEAGTAAPRRSVPASPPAAARSASG